MSAHPVLSQALELEAAGFAAIFQKGKQAFQPGWNRERRTAEQLREAFKPGLNVAVVTGALSVHEGRALIVIDCDVRQPDAKAEAWRALRELIGDRKPTTRTGGGGAHWWYWIWIDRLPPRDKLVLAQGPEVEIDGRRKPAWTIEVLLNGHACTVPPSIHPSGKRYEWANGSAHVEDAPAALVEAIERTARAAGAKAAPVVVAASQSPPQSMQNDPQWPDPLDAAASHGIAGEIVRAIEPRSEADSAALLLQVLVAFGALVGRGPHVRVEGDEHHVNLFALLVGETSKARKGTSWGRVREIFSHVAEWPHVVSGLSSGEGLKWAVRDAIQRVERDKKTGAAVVAEADPGIADKRLLVVEAEFAQVLRQAARAGNTLSPTVRSAWDTGHLATLTKNDPVTATGAHICIIGHITADELRAELTATDTANGFANRFLFMCVRRSKALPFGGEAPADDVLTQLASRIERAAGRARKLGAVGMTEAARQIWADVYPTLSEGHPGLFGAVTARAEAQCLRLALAYALLDEVDAIDRPHLLAAIAVWERAEASARYIFGSALGDPVADDILRALRVSGGTRMTRTEIRDLFKRHEKAERIGAALELLARRRLAAREDQQAQGGRLAEVWRAV